MHSELEYILLLWYENYTKIFLYTTFEVKIPSNSFGDNLVESY